MADISRIKIPLDNTIYSLKDISSRTMTNANITADTIYLLGTKEQTSNITTYSRNTIYIDENDLLYSNGNRALTAGGSQNTLATATYISLPDTYTELQYIQSSGTQRIDTGIKPENSATKYATYGFRGKFSIVSASGDWNLINLGGSSTDNYRYGFGGYSTSRFQIAPIGGSSGWHDISNPAPTIGTVYEFEYNYNSSRACIINNTTVKSELVAGSGYGYGVNWNIFCQAYGTSSYTRYLSGRLYSLKIYQGTTLLRDFIPCKNSSNSVGLYDLISETFYTDANGGTFIAGPEV